jgi:putative spermidine/putrescine transport system substrate-binding protein
MVKKIAVGFLGLLLSLSLAACGGSNGTKPAGQSEKPADAAKELVVVDWGGAMAEAHKKAIYEPFEKLHGIKITTVAPTDYGKLKAMVQSGSVDWDVVMVDSDFSIRGGKDNLLEKLDYNIINKDGVKKELVDDYGIGADVVSTAISYNTKTFPGDNHPRNWAEFWDTAKFPGKRSLYKYPTGVLEAALLADGVKPEQLYPLDVDRAFASLDKIKKDIKVWWTAGAQPAQLLANNEVTAAMAWNGRISTGKAQGAPIEVEYNQALLQGDSWVIPKGAPHKELAQKFIAYAVSPEAQAAFSTIIDYSPSNDKALDLLPKEVRERLGQTPEKAGNQVLVDIHWWVDNFDKVNERFQEWLLK